MITPSQAEEILRLAKMLATMRCRRQSVGYGLPGARDTATVAQNRVARADEKLRAYLDDITTGETD